MRDKMILAIGYADDYVWSLGVDSTDPELVASALTIYGRCIPDQILLIQNDKVFRHYRRGGEY